MGNESYVGVQVVRQKVGDGLAECWVMVDARALRGVCMAGRRQSAATTASTYGASFDLSRAEPETAPGAFVFGSPSFSLLCVLLMR